MTDFYEDEISSQIVAELDHRVKRLEFYLTGALELEDVPRDEASIKPDLHSRLKGIEDTVSKAAAQRRVLQDMVNLYTKYPELFPNDTLIPSTFSKSEPGSKNEPSLDRKLTDVDACAPMFPCMVSRLNLLKDLSIPAPELTASLLSVKPRLARAEAVQDCFAEDVAELRLRSVLLLQRWIKIGIQSAGHCWADWEERLLGVEKMVRRAEVAREQAEQA